MGSKGQGQVEEIGGGLEGVNHPKSLMTLTKIVSKMIILTKNNQ